MPRWVKTEMRTNHAGEFGAVRIYEGSLKGLRLHHALLSREPVCSKAVEFLEEHMENEQKHLTLMEELTAPELMGPGARTRLIPIWRLAGLLTGFLPALVSGRRGIYHTISAVETFVEEHYLDQIVRMKNEKVTPHLRARLESCCEDEVEHREEAEQALLGLDAKDGGHGPAESRKPSWGVRVWSAIVDFGSRRAVELSRVV